MDLKIKIEEKEGGNSLTVSLAGSLDTDTYIQFEKRMAEALNLSVKGVILNMEGLTYISSIGFAAIFRIK